MKVSAMTAEEIAKRELHAAHRRAINSKFPVRAFNRLADSADPRLAKLRERLGPEGFASFVHRAVAAEATAQAARKAAQERRRDKATIEAVPSLDALSGLVGPRQWSRVLADAGAVEQGECRTCQRSIRVKVDRVECCCGSRHPVGLLVDALGSRQLAASFLAGWLSERRKGPKVAAITDSEVIEDPLWHWSKIPHGQPQRRLPKNE